MTDRKRAGYNRQQVVEAPSHPDCRACEVLRDKVDQQIVANAALRVDIMDLEAKLREYRGEGYKF